MRSTSASSRRTCAATERLRELLARASSARLAYLPRRDQYGRDLAQLMLDGQDVDGEDRRAAGYRSGHRYSLENLGVDPGRLAATFGWVYDRFGYPRPGD